MDFLSYREKLNDLLDDLRAERMGQRVTFRELIPCGAMLPPRVLAQRTAQALTLWVARFEKLDERDVRAGHRWLTIACRFLAEHCPEADRSIYCLLKMARLSRETLEILAEDRIAPGDVETFAHPPYFLNSGLEHTAWELLGEKGQRERVKGLDGLGL